MIQRPRVVVTESGIADEDDRARSAARALRDAGLEVVFVAGPQPPAQLADAAIQEDADAVVVMDRPHVRTEVLDRLAERGAADVLVLGDEPAGEIVERLRPDPN